MLSVLVFWIFAGIALVFATGVIVCRNPMHSAACLVAALAGIAGVYLHLHAEFLAWIQILVYTGAVMVLIVFVVALLNLQQEEKLSLAAPRVWGVFLALTFLVLMGVYLTLDKSFGFHGPAKPPVEAISEQVSWGGAHFVSAYLFGPYLYAVEVTAVLLTAAVVGAVMLTRKGRDEVE